MTTSASDLTNALALIDTAVRAIRQAEPAMVRFLGAPDSHSSPENVAVWAAVAPIFCKAIDLMRTHESRLVAARAALEKVTAA